MSGIVAPRMMRLPVRRRDQIWLAVIVSLIVHVLLFLAISLFKRPPAPPPPPAMEITIADDVGLTAGSPNTAETPAESKAPEIAPPVDAAPPEPSPAKAEPAPPVPQPKAAAPPQPAAVAKPQPKVAAAPAKQPARTPAKPAAAAPAKPAPVPGKGKTGTLPRPAGGLTFSKNYFGGATNQPSTGTATTPKAPTMTPQARANIASKIAQQIQPCALNHKLPPTPGIDKVRVIMDLSFARDGNPSAPPRVVRIEGLDDSTQRYADLVKRSALATFNDKRCQPIKGLPAELYDVPGGWKSVPMGFKLPG